MELLRLDATRDSDAVEDVVRRSMRASYALSPEQRDTVVEAEFDEEALREKSHQDDLVLFVARRDEDIAGFAEGELDADGGEIRWLHVDPEARGGGIGTELFERLSSSFSDGGGSDVRGSVLSEDLEGSSFCERFGFVRVEGIEVAIGDEQFVAEMYTNSSDGDADERANEFSMDDPPPDTVEDEDGTELHVDADDPLSGTIAPFFEAFVDPEFEDRHGYLCGSCGTVSTSVDQQGRIVCDECGNHHRPDEWDASHL